MTHRKRIIDRDLKPDKVMVVREENLPAGKRAKILNFEIAKLLPDGIEDTK